MRFSRMMISTGLTKAIIEFVVTIDNLHSYLFIYICCNNTYYISYIYDQHLNMLHQNVMLNTIKRRFACEGR
jgi:hypothetical protein